MKITTEDIVKAIEQSRIIHLDEDARYMFVFRATIGTAAFYADFRKLIEGTFGPRFRYVALALNDPEKDIRVIKLDKERDEHLAENARREVANLQAFRTAVENAIVAEKQERKPYPFVSVAFRREDWERCRAVLEGKDASLCV